MVVAIIQARMGSSRLPGKVLKEVGGRPLLSYQLERVLKSKFIDKVVVATSTLEKDNALADFCEENQVACFRGSEDDVLSRYYDCAKMYSADTVVRLTGDCPLSDPAIIDAVIQKFLNDKVDYCANTVPIESATFPDGTDVEVFGMEALTKAFQEIKDPHFREHVTFQFWQTDGYSSTQYCGERDFSNYRLTVDYREDYEVVKFIFETLQKRDSFGDLEEIIEIIESNGEIKALNAHYTFGEGWKK
jgi:spore coat polysaccharide biosynthesis protein SpsF